MNIEDIVESYGIERVVAEKAVLANGFPLDGDFEGEEYHLITLYLDYLEAMEDSKEARRSFQYTDGEESVNKSKVYDQYRRYAMDLFGAWSSAKRDYDQSKRGLDSFFTIRGRAGVLDERTR